MAQILIRNVPDAVKARLSRRAKRNGRSLEAEMREILNSIPEAPSKAAVSAEGWGTRLARRMREIGVTNADVDVLESKIGDLRHDARVKTLKDLGLDK